jgi:small subunit ribosomal protein S17
MAEQADNTEKPAGAEAPQDAATASAPAAAAPQAPAQAAAEVLPPKERRRRLRARRAAKRPALEAMTPEQRQAHREAERRRKASARRTERARQRRKRAEEVHDRQPTPPREHVAGTQKVRQGVVVSDKADKTITVRIDVARRHRRYQKIVRTSMTLHAHDERNDAHVGDTVVVREARPLSRTKRWRLVEVVERAR